MQNKYFPIELTKEEQSAGFRIVRTQMPPSDSWQLVAVLPLKKSFRLIKTIDMVMGGTAYSLEVFSTDVHPWPPAWNTVWESSQCTLESAMTKYRLEPIDPAHIITDPTDELDNIEVDSEDQETSIGSR